MAVAFKKRLVGGSLEHPALPTPLIQPAREARGLDNCDSLFIKSCEFVEKMLVSKLSQSVDFWPFSDRFSSDVVHFKSIAML